MLYNIRKVKNYGIKKAFYDKYNVNEVLQENKLTPEQIAKEVEEVIKKQLTYYKIILYSIYVTYLYLTYLFVCYKKLIEQIIIKRRNMT